MTTKTNKNLPVPHKIERFQLGDDPNGGAVFFYGKPDSNKIAIFCAGYPDDHENGQVFCSRLAEENDTLVGLTCLPGYDDRPEKRWYTHKPEGYTFDEMAGGIRDAVKVLRAESTNENAKLTAIFHDWGVVPGMIWANRSLEDSNADSPSEIVLFDVLTKIHKTHKEGLPEFDKPSFHKTFVTHYYRLVFAFAFGIQKYFSKYLALPCFFLGFMPMMLLPIGPTLAIDDKIHTSRVKPLDPFRMIYMTYPYFELYKTVLNGTYSVKLADATLPKDLKKTPVLYLYGTEKRVQFHDDRDLYVLEREAKENRSKSNAENAGHYLYIQQADLCLDEVKKFMS